jgi:hypothetical protein
MDLEYKQDDVKERGELLGNLTKKHKLFSPTVD